jgi:hypothetical protein
VVKLRRDINRLYAIALATEIVNFTRNTDRIPYPTALQLDLACEPPLYQKSKVWSNPSSAVILMIPNKYVWITDFTLENGKRKLIYLRF